KEKIFDLRTQAKIGLNVELEEQKQALQRNLYPHPPTAQVEVKQLVYLLTIYGQSLYTTTNEMTLYKDGRKKFDALLKDIEGATDHIHMQYYIYRSDTLGGEIRDALIRAAKRGVKVRVLLDAWGSTQVSLKFFDELR
ncbi:TPA: cardiolipin synthase, partial [Enterococcus faecium]|nr:cardiolipin synthase [Enterococcus faecium]